MNWYKMSNWVVRRHCYSSQVSLDGDLAISEILLVVAVPVEISDCLVKPNEEGLDQAEVEHEDVGDEADQVGVSR